MCNSFHFIEFSQVIMQFKRAHTQRTGTLSQFIHETKEEKAKHSNWKEIFTRKIQIALLHSLAKECNTNGKMLFNFSFNLVLVFFSLTLSYFVFQWKQNRLMKIKERLRILQLIITINPFKMRSNNFLSNFFQFINFPSSFSNDKFHSWTNLFGFIRRPFLF